MRDTRPRLLTPEEVAEIMRTSPAALAQQRYKGNGIPFVRDGRRILYRAEDVDAYIESRVMTRTDDRPGAA